MKKINTMWVIFGMMIVSWNIFWFVNVKILSNYDKIFNVILLNAGFLVLVIYIIITLIIIKTKKIGK